MSFNRESLIGLVAGGCGGTLGAIITCPLEVVKTRMQSSTSSFMAMTLPPPAAHCKPATTCSNITSHHSTIRKVLASVIGRSQVHSTLQLQLSGNPHSSLSLIHCLKYIHNVEGTMALWKGLGPNLVGVVPTRAIYFCFYTYMKKNLTSSYGMEEGLLVNGMSSSFAGFIACTVTNPIWFIKTRLQLDNSKSGQKIGAVECAVNVFKTKGFLGFYKGITASYFGISETMIHFVIYEKLKKEFNAFRHNYLNVESTYNVEIMIASLISKTTASSLCYPHEVARTRLREEGTKYKGFAQTLFLVFKEEGWPGLYRGFFTQFVRQIPNTIVLMVTYECVASYLNEQYSEEVDDNED